MRKGTRIFKKYIATFLIVLMSINTLGAVVSDNDGSAFITKAEFDSLKNDFQAQIDQYNTSIDSKIDGAIASYLAGVSVKATEKITLFLDKIKNYTFYWTSDVNFSNHPNRPMISEKFIWSEYYLSTAFKMEYNKQFNDFYIETGTKHGDNFIVDGLFKWGYTLTADCWYWFGGLNDQGYVGGRWPSNACWEALKTVSLSKQSGSGSTCWCDGASREVVLDPDNTGGWRGSSAYVAFSSNKTATSSIILAPFSSKKTYVYDTGNESNQNEKITGSQDSASQYLNFDAAGWGTIQDVRYNKRIQTKDPTTLDISSQQNRWPDINAAGASIPWLTKTYDVKELKFKSLIDASDFDKPIKYGVCLYKAEKAGTYDFKFIASKSGYGLFYVGKDGITNWGTPSSHAAGVTYIACDGVHEASVRLSTQKDENLFFIYYPNDSDDISQVNFVHTYFTTE